MLRLTENLKKSKGWVLPPNNAGEDQRLLCVHAFRSCTQTKQTTASSLRTTIGSGPAMPTITITFHKSTEQMSTAVPEQCGLT